MKTMTYETLGAPRYQELCHWANEIALEQQFDENGLLAVTVEHTISFYTADGELKYFEIPTRLVNSKKDLETGFGVARDAYITAFHRGLRQGEQKVQNSIKKALGL